MTLNPLPPILVAELFPALDKALLDVLTALPADAWQRPTIVPNWTIKDIAAHLLDGNIRALSMLRDSYWGVVPPPIETYQDLVNFLNGLNAEWVQASKRLSPQVLLSFLAQTGKEFCEVMAQLPPFEKAAFSVAWAGEEESLNWFHIAREYTEKWHHQQQICLAVGKEEILYAPAFFAPHLATSMRALPHHYRAVEAPENTALQFDLVGEAGGTWYLHRIENAWRLAQENLPTARLACQVSLDTRIAWRIFAKGISRSEATQHLQITGDRALGGHLLDMLAIMA